MGTNCDRRGMGVIGVTIFNCAAMDGRLHTLGLGRECPQWVGCTGIGHGMQIFEIDSTSSNRER